MKTLGLIGGLTWESSLLYYRIINEAVSQRLGGLHSAQCLMWSFDFAPIAALQSAGDWATATQQMIDAAQSLERGGAQGLLICANTMHRMAPEIEASVNIPLIHIVDVTGQAIQQANLHRVALLGTRYTMQQDFYKARLQERFGLDVLVPTADAMDTVHNIIYDELARGIVRDESRTQYQQVIDQLAQQGAEGVVLGCTEIPMLIGPEDSTLPTFDTTTLHALAAVDWALR